MKDRHAILLLLFLLFGVGVAAADDTASPNPPPGDKKTAKTLTGDYVGADVCITCHEDQGKRFSHTVMGRAFAHANTSNEKRGCESCHGPGKAHVEAGGGKETIPVRFGKDSKNSIAEQNSACLSCHSKGNRMFWRGSPHETRGLACVNCHQVMQPKQTSLSSEARFRAPLTEVQATQKSQPELCLQCHQMRRAQLQRSSHMPFREGKVTCTSCHNPHGSPNPKQLIQTTLNENCYSCHAERRGPFLWEHPPVMENCGNCHEPHGSTNPQLLKVRAPRLCQQCHAVADSRPGGGHSATPHRSDDHMAFNRSCTNCHVEIHGSNSPSGVRFHR